MMMMMMMHSNIVRSYERNVFYFWNVHVHAYFNVRYFGVRSI